jgi:hypothetical protein
MADILKTPRPTINTAAPPAILPPVNPADQNAWQDPRWIDFTQILLDSYEHWLHKPLIDRTGSPADQSRRAFEAPFVTVAHNTEADPILCYANRVALNLWQMDLATLTRTPSRLTAEPVHRDERARLLDRTTRHGYVDDYCGIRISSTGQRFEIHQAIVWNLIDPTGRPAGQAATFAHWTFL